MKKQKIWGLVTRCLLCVLIVWVLACKKDEEHEPVKQVTQVYTTGTLYNQQTNVYYPAYWLDSQQHNLPFSPARRAFAYGMAVRPQELFIAGIYMDHRDERYKPCYWLNGQKYDLPIADSWAYEQAGARDVQYFNNSYYVLGHIDTRSVVWKIQNNTVTKFMALEGEAGSLTHHVLGSGNLTQHGGRLYIGGVQVVRTAAGDEPLQPGYWTIDADDQVTFRVIDQQAKFSLCYSIAATDEGVFTVGEATPVFDRRMAEPAFWRNQAPFVLSKNLNASKQRWNEIMADHRGNLYLNILDIGTYKPLVWKVTPTGQVQEITPDIPDGATGLCENIGISPEAVVFSGTYQLNRAYHGWYWLNGQRTELEIDNRYFVTLSRTQVVHQ